MSLSRSNVTGKLLLRAKECSMVSRRRVGVTRVVAALAMMIIPGAALWSQWDATYGRGLSLAACEACLGGVCANRGCVEEACNLQEPGNICLYTGLCQTRKLYGGDFCAYTEIATGEKCGDKPGWHQCSETTGGRCGHIWRGEVPEGGDCTPASCPSEQGNCGSMSHSCTATECPPEET